MEAVSLGFCNETLLNWFFPKTGKWLTLFDSEIVYTTEDEINITRGKELDTIRSEEEIDVFWHGYVMGKWDMIKLKCRNSNTHPWYLQRLNLFYKIYLFFSALLICILGLKLTSLSRPFIVNI